MAFLVRVPCRPPYRSPGLPAAHLTRIVGPLAARKAVAGQTQQRDSIGPIRAYPGIFRAYSGHIPGISGHIRAYPGNHTSSGKKKGHRVRYRSVPGTASRRVIACGIVRCRARHQGWSSRAVSFVARHGVGEGHRVRYRLSPDRVPYGPSLDRVSVCACPCRRPRCPWHVHGRASRTPDREHAPAQQRAVADAATGGLRTYFLLHGRGVLSWCVRRRG